jgi:chromate transporter
MKNRKPTIIIEAERGEKETPAALPSAYEVFLYFLLLGFINIGGPVAQITMMFNHMVEKRRWLSKDRFVKIMAFSHMLPGPEALQLAIYIGYLKRKWLGGILAGLTFIIPGAAVMVVLSKLYLAYGQLAPVNNALSVLKPAVMGIIAAGIIKLGRAAIKGWLLGAILVGAFIAMRFLHINFLLVLLMGGLINLLFAEGFPLVKKLFIALPLLGATAPGIASSKWLQILWVSLKTGALSFGGAYASLVFIQNDAVDRYHWLSGGQLLDGVALSVATPGPFMLFVTFVGYLAGGLMGAILATVFVFLPSFIFVLFGAKYMEQVRQNRWIQAFLSGASAAVVGVIMVVSLMLIPEAFTTWASIGLGLVTFFLIMVIDTNVAWVAIGAMIVGALYAALKAFV